jgi:hypothetical protein
MQNDITQWMIDLTDSGEPADYFLHPQAFPYLLLPWWIEKQLRGTHNEAFQGALILMCCPRRNGAN